MFNAFFFWFGALARLFRSRRDIVFENLVLRQQLTVLKRLLLEYVSYYHDDRTHLRLGKGTPAGRTPSKTSGRILSRERLGGLHHRYDRAA